MIRWAHAARGLRTGFALVFVVFVVSAPLPFAHAAKAAGAGDSAAAISATPPAPGTDSVSVILLGTGNPYPSARAQGPATAVLVGRRIFLFDAGPGVERQMEAAGLPVRGGPVTAVFLTHLHSDHTLGLPDLLLTSWVMGRHDPLPVYGPPGTRAMVDHIFAAWAEDIRIREQGLEHETPGGWHADVHEIRGGPVYEADGVTVRAIPVPHGSWKWAFGYRIDVGRHSIVISGDTAPSTALEQAARGVDLLIHEVYPEARAVPEKRPGGDAWPKYLRAFHTSDEELGALAARAAPRKLVLYHVTSRGPLSDDDLIQGVRRGGFQGPAVVGHDLDRLIP